MPVTKPVAQPNQGGSLIHSKLFMCRLSAVKRNEAYQSHRSVKRILPRGLHGPVMMYWATTGGIG